MAEDQESIGTIIQGTPGTRGAFAQLVDAQAAKFVNADKSDDDSDEGESDSEETEDSEGEEETDDTEDEEEEDEDSEEDDEEAEEEEEDSETEGKKPDFTPTKPLKLKTPDGKTIDVPPDTKLRVKVDGEWKNIDFHTFRNRIASEESLETRRGEIEEVRTEVEQAKRTNERIAAQYRQLDRTLTNVFEKVKEGKGLESYHEIARLAGYDNHVDWEIDHLNALAPYYEQLRDMDDTQRQLHFAQKRINAEKEIKEASTKKNTGDNSWASELQEITEQRGYTSDEVESAMTLLAKVKRAGKHKQYGFPEVLRPQHVGDIIDTWRANERVDGAIEKFSPGLDAKLGKKKTLEVKKILAKAIKTYDIDDKDLEGLLRDAVSKDLAEADEREDAKTLKRKTRRSKPSGDKKTAKSKKKRGQRVLTFSDLDPVVNNLRSTG